MTVIKYKMIIYEVPHLFSKILKARRLLSAHRQFLHRFRFAEIGGYHGIRSLPALDGRS